MDYGNTKTPSMHCRLGSATLFELAFPRQSNPNFPWEKFQWDNTAVQKIVMVLFTVHVAHHFTVEEDRGNEVE